MQDLLNRIAEMRTELEQADPDQREALLEHLEQAVLGLEGAGVDIPQWAREALEARHESQAEDLFDNMPL